MLKRLSYHAGNYKILLSESYSSCLCNGFNATKIHAPPQDLERGGTKLLMKRTDNMHADSNCSQPTRESHPATRDRITNHPNPEKHSMRDIHAASLVRQTTTLILLVKCIRLPA